MKKSSNPKTPIDIKTGKPNTKPSTKPKRPKKHKLQPGQHPAEVTPVFSDQQKRVLDLLATGCSMAAAAEAVSYTHWALQKWMQRDEVFHYYADRARGIHTSDIYDAFHEVETDARVLLQEIIRDHDVAPHIRLRAALAALNRKDDAWLPRPIHVGTPLVPPQGAEPNLDGGIESSDDRLDQKCGEQSDAAQTEAEPSGWAHTETSRNSTTENDAAHIGPASSEQSDAAQGPASGHMKVPVARTEQNERRPPDNQPSEARPSQPPVAQNEPGSPASAPIQPQFPEANPQSQTPNPGSSRAERVMPLVRHHADKTAPPADKTEILHLTANQSLPQQTANFRPPEFSANADKINITRERSERNSGENQPSEARPPQPPASQNIPGPTVAAPIQPRDTKSSHKPQGTSHGGDETMRLDAAFLSKYTVLRHENPKDFAHLLAELTGIYEPQAQAEELQVLRMAQAHWNLRRIDTMQTAVLDSTVDQIRSIIPDAHPAAAIASKFLGKDPSDQVWFLDRMHHYRKFHDEYLDRQENRLFRLQERRAYDPIRQAKLAALRPKRQEIGPFPTRQARLTGLADKSFLNQLAPTGANLEHHQGEHWRH